ncbi:MAG: hypothetical protein ACPG4T_01860 [Nannocystaceae bacterium]
MTRTELRTWIEEQITKFIPHLGKRSEKTDAFLGSKIAALVDALDAMNEADSDEAYGDLIKRRFRAHKGGLDAYHDILTKLGVEHEYNE